MQIRKGQDAFKKWSGKAERNVSPESGKGNLDISEYVKKVFYCASSLRIRLMLVKNTIPGIIMNPMPSTLKISAQLSPIIAPLI